jgi:putative flippase GtrA
MAGTTSLVRSHPRRAAIFIAIGVINTAIDISAFACLYRLLGLDIIASNVLAFLIAVTNSYVLNFLITFADRSSGRGALGRFPRFLLVAVIALSVSTVIVSLLSVFIHPLLAKLVATAASTTVNYLGCCRFVFSSSGRIESGATAPSE